MTVLSKEVLVYKNVPFTKYRWISYFALFHLGVVAFNLFFLATPKLVEEREEAIKNKYRLKKVAALNDSSPQALIERWEINPDYNPETLLMKIRRSLNKDILTFENIKNNLVERPYISALLIASTGSVMGLFIFYAHRMVHRLVLLPNDRVRFECFNAFPVGKPIVRELSLTDVSCKAGRNSDHNYSLLKIRDKWGYFLVHKKEGEFVEPKLYDESLGFKRSWAVRNK